MLLTILLISVIFLGAILGSFIWLTKNPLVIHVDVPPISIAADFSNLIPQPVVVQWQTLLPDQKPSGIPEEPMPMEIFAYCAQESEEHAMVSRQRYARHLRNTLGSWDAALARLKQEDEIS